MAGRPPHFESSELLEQAIQEYFDNTVEAKGIITITGLAYHLGFESRQSFYDYEKNEQFSYIIKRARLFVESCYEERVNGTSPTGAIFVLKNMGWKDKTETGITDKDGNDVKPVIQLMPAPNCEPIKPSE